MTRITEREKIFLLEIARESIRSWLGSTGFRYEPSLQNIISLDRPIVLENVGAFVSIYKDGTLRGCMGFQNPGYPLYLVVRDMAIEAAVKDQRFSPITFPDFNDIILEVSVLTPPVKIQSIDEIDLKRHSVYIVKNGKSGSFFPHGFDNLSTEEFLKESVDKMGFYKYDDWKTGDIYISDTISFNEKQYGLK